jgi:hypothetical protein
MKVFDEVVDTLYNQLMETATKEGYSPHIYLNHHGTGTNFRNNLKLWWSPDWNEPKPAIVEFFNSKNIYHADDMSGCIMEALEARVGNKEFDFDTHIQIYFLHWKQAGFKDGIYKPN